MFFKNVLTAFEPTFLLDFISTPFLLYLPQIICVFSPMDYSVFQYF
jgi:hypothetical protein